uniref:Prokineticin 2 n=1 Tax=Cyanoderma ruficeps TaxID=181631 RepID=A0A8C3NZM5_9PASS
SWVWPRAAPRMVLALNNLVSTPKCARSLHVPIHGRHKYCKSQCGGGMCCAVSLWIRSLRMCTPMGNLGDECHPLSHRVPFSGRRTHHSCPCLPGLACLRTAHSRFRCLPAFRKEDVFF